MKKLIGILPIALLYLGLSSCLKDELYTADTSESPNVVEIAGVPDESAAEGFIFPAFSSSLDYEDMVEIPVTIKYSGTNVAPFDIVVAIQVDAAALEKFNEEAGEELYTLAPSTFYTLPSNQITIKKGEKTAVFIIQAKPKAMNYDSDYAIPLSIKSATESVISGNFGTVLFHIVPKNIYDGDYNATGVFTHPSLGPRDIDRHKIVSTTGQYSVSTEAGDVDSPVGLVVDPLTNDVTFTGELSATQPFVPIPGERSYYDPATESFHLNYQYTGGGGFRVIRETLVKE